MLKRRAAWPRGIRWLFGGIAAVVLALAIAWVLFVPGADWLAHHDIGPAKGPPLQAARDAARGRLLTLAAGLFAAGALLFTARNFALSRRTFELTEQGQVTDRYTKAIEQLGSDKLDVRIGGIYALERIARDSARDHPTVMEVLTALIREHSYERPDGTELGRSMWPDVQAALTVVGRRDTKLDIRRIQLFGADLREARLSGGDFSHANFGGADLTSAVGVKTNLHGANITHANLTRTVLNSANLTHANLNGKLISASLRWADLTDAHLGPVGLQNVDLTLTMTNTDLTDAHLNGAILIRASLYRANLTGADLTEADLTDADLTDADLTRAKLFAANLTRAKWPRSAPVPDGWKLDTSSGRLERACTDSGPTEAN